MLLLCMALYIHPSVCDIGRAKVALFGDMTRPRAGFSSQIMACSETSWFLGESISTLRFLTTLVCRRAELLAPPTVDVEVTVTGELT
jgi:hypothetical protein